MTTAGIVHAAVRVHRVNAARGRPDHGDQEAVTAGRVKEGRRAFRGHMVRRGQKAIVERPERLVQQVRRDLPEIPGRPA